MRYLIVLISLVLISCNTQKRIDAACAKCPRHDSVIIKEVVKVSSFDTTLFLSRIGKNIELKYDSIAESQGYCCLMVNELNALIAANNGTIAVKESGIKSSIYKSNGKVIFRCEADSLRALIKGLRTIIETSKSKVETKILPAPKCEKPHKDWLDEYDRPWFFISLGALLLWFGWKFKPKLLTLFKKVAS